ncbi:MAG TPA: TolC family protein [Verrucomicrobiae bacterium]|nr:TolC family protein [Verrucomicrobiae bacterium]
MNGIGQEKEPPPSAPILTVDQIANHVLQKNPEANFYRAEIAAAKGERRAAGTLANPELSAQAGGKRQAESGGLAGEGLAWSVAVNQTFEFPGRLALRKAIANRQLQLAELGYAQFQASLTAKARQLGLAVLSAQERANAATQVANRARELATVMVRRDPAGVSPLLETRILEASAITFMRRSAEAHKELQRALTELNQLRGAPLQARLLIARENQNHLSPPPLEELLASARTNNFSLRMRQVELEQQGIRVDLARNERYPTVTVGPYYSEEKARDFERQAGVGISLPLPLWNRNQSNIEIASARKAQAETSLLVAQRELEKGLVQAVATYETALAQMRHWPANALRHFQDAAELGDRHYRLGAIPVATYVELQKEYLDAIEAILTTEADADAAQSEMRLLAGWIQPSPAPGASAPKP